jgi:hypothetical protein
MKYSLTRLVEVALVPLAAAIVFIEQTLIRLLNAGMETLARWTPIARFEGWLVRQPPWVAFLSFVAPSILILPIKLSALMFVAHRKFGMAIAAVIIGKILATAIVARLYRILRPTLMTIGWFAAADTWFFHWRDQAYAFVRSLPAWQKAASLVERSRVWLAESFPELYAYRARKKPGAN